MRSRFSILFELPALAMLVMWLWWLFGLWALRLGYPFDLEWMEGGMLVHVWRLREGLGLYVEPSVDFIPYIYPPLYPWVLSLVGDPSYVSARGLSILGTLAACGAAVYAVRKEGATWGISLGAAGLYLSCYVDSGTFYDVVRNDSLAIGLASWAIALGRQGSRRAVTASGLLLAVAFLAKHNYAAFGVPMVLWLWYTHGIRRALLFTACSAGPALAATIGLQIASGGYFLTYLVEVPGGHPLVAERAWPKSEIELVSVLKYTSGAAVLLGLVGWRRPRGPAVYWLGVLAMASGLCILMRAHLGGFINVLMPGHWTIAVCGAAMLGVVAKRWQHPAVLLAMSCLIGFQLWDKRVEDDTRYIPTAEDVAAGEQVLDAIASYEGPVFAPQFPWYPAMVGKQPSFPLIALWDIDHKGGPLKKEAGVMRKGFKQHHWPVVLTAQKSLKRGFEDHYKKQRKLSLPGRVFYTRTGWRVKPVWFWEPKPPAPEPDARAPERTKPAPTLAPGAPVVPKLPASPGAPGELPDQAPSAP